MHKTTQYKLNVEKVKNNLIEDSESQDRKRRVADIVKRNKRLIIQCLNTTTLNIQGV